MSRPPLPALPIDEALPALTHALQNHPRVLLQAPPGAGKSTIVPLAVSGSPWLSGRKILMLEPRRLAARAVANRMAQLLGETVGTTVGYRTRLDTRVGRDTRIEVVTEGILTRMLQTNSELPGIGLVIFDEFHERSLNADLGLALCLETQSTLREDLRLLVMSATLDLAPLAKLLDGAPIVTSRGRAFDVETRYVPRRPDIELELQVAQMVRNALSAHDGDILCFLPGAAEINRVQRNLEAAGLGEGSARSGSAGSGGSGSANVTILPLYGELAGAAQDAALAPARPGRRKIVLATTIAETSLTIEGVRIVVDSGLRRHAEFDAATGMSRLVTSKVSQASADQRRGRAGRISAGWCYRLWSEGSQASLASQTAPEIAHADLAPLALELSCWGATDATTLRWLDPPPAAPLAQARDLLQQLDAIDATGRVTAHGRALAQVGAHPRLAHMLVKSRTLGAPRLGSDLAAILSERDILRAAFGARDVDLRLRVSALRGGGSLPHGISIDPRALAQASRSSARWQSEFARGMTDTEDPHQATGRLLALAYPDRVGRARGEGGRYVLANGRGARFGEPQALAKSEFIVAAELDGADREARIFLAAPVSLDNLGILFADRITDTSEIAWDEREQRVSACRKRRLGELVLESTDLRHPDPGAFLAAALTGLKQLGLAALPWTEALAQWRARVALMRKFSIPAPEPWPDLSDAALLATLDEWAPQWIVGFSRRDHFARMDLVNALHSRLSYAQNKLLDREAPTHYVVPSGSRMPVDYLDGEVPTISVRLQEMFGLHETPSMAGGKLPLLLKLLSPAHRPVQITRDLVSFWERGYHDVKKDLKGRYPKHYWPDDPYTAAPTARRSRPRSA